MSDQPIYTYYKQWGNNILFRYRKNGISHAKTINFYKPSLFTVDKSATDSQESIFGQPLKQHIFDDIRAAKAFAEQYKHVDGIEIHGNSNFGNQFVIEFYKGEMPDFKAKDIRVGILDIEVYSPDEFPEPSKAAHPINGITIYDSFTDTFYVFGMVDYVHDKQHKQVGKLNVVYRKFDDEIALLTAMLMHFSEFQYDATTGWNSETFDMPYIVNRCFALVGKSLTSNSLSPFGNIRIDTFTSEYGTELMKVDIQGLPHLDYLSLYKKHIHSPRESYKLGDIAAVELGSTKLSYEEEGSIANLFKMNPQLFTEYNVVDVLLIKQLDDKLGLLNTTYTIAYYTLSNYEDTLGTTKVWEQLVAKHLYGKNVAPLFKKRSGVYRDFEGGYVRDPILGFIEWPFTVDLNSLYPHLEMEFNIGPETHVPREQLPRELATLKATYTIDDLVNGTADLSALKKYDLAMTANFEFYRKDKMSFFSEIKRDLYTRRKTYKKQMLVAEQAYADAKNSGADYSQFEEQKAKFDNLQMAMKILLNAGYGAGANEHFLYFMIENAEAITTSGQLVNRYTSTRVERHLQNLLGTNEPLWVYSDTDSSFYTLKVFHDKVLSQVTDVQKKVDIIDKFIKTHVDPFIVKQTDALADMLNAYENKMVWEREVIAERCVFVAKKRYAMKVWDNEGVRYKGTPKYKIMGLEAIRSSTPEWARAYLKECYTITLEKDEEKLHDRFAEIEREFMSMPVEKIAIPRGVNQLEKWATGDGEVFKSGTPKNVKAALIHNELVDQKGLKIKKITSGSKIKYIDLKKQNPTGFAVIGFEGYLPKEFGLEQYIDRATIFESSFKSALELFLTPVGWTAVRVVSLEDFFG